jgi:hypothetical protein
MPLNATTTMQLSISYNQLQQTGRAASYGLDDQRVGVQVPEGSRIFSSPRRPDWFWGHATSYTGLKRPGREADYSPPGSAEVKKMWIYTFPNMPSWRSAQLLEHRDNFTLVEPIIMTQRKHKLEKFDI